MGEWWQVGGFLLLFAAQTGGLFKYISVQGDRVGRLEVRILEQLGAMKSDNTDKREALSQLFAERIEGVRTNLELQIRAEVEKQNKSRHDHNNKLSEDYKAFVAELKAIARELQRLERESVRKDELTRLEGQVSSSVNRIEASIIARIDKGESKFDALSAQVGELVAFEKTRQRQSPERSTKA